MNLFTDVKSAVASKINDVRRLLMSKYAILINNSPHIYLSRHTHPTIHCEHARLEADSATRAMAVILSSLQNTLLYGANIKGL